MTHISNVELLHSLDLIGADSNTRTALVHLAASGMPPADINRITAQYTAGRPINLPGEPPRPPAPVAKRCAHTNVRRRMFSRTGVCNDCLATVDATPSQETT